MFPSFLEKLFLRAVSVIFLCGITVPQGLGAQAVVLNEIVASNGQTLRDENGDAPDWIELFNPGADAVDLTGFGLSDAGSQPFKWRFASGLIPARGFLVVFASGKNRQPAVRPARDPASVQGLAVWLRADSIALTDPSQVRVSGGSVYVRSWRDSSGRGRHAEQPSDSRQPLCTPSSELNGNRVVRFDGMNDMLALAASPAGNSFSILVVARTSVSHELDAESASGVGGVSGQRYLFGAGHGGEMNGGAGLSVGTNGISVYEHGSNYMPALAVQSGRIGAGFVIISVVYDNKQPSIYLNGSHARTGLRSPRSTVSAPTEIGAGAYGAFQGDAAEILMFDRALGDEDRRGIEEHLARKHGLILPAYYHTNFEIRASGERVRLTRPDGALSDEMASTAIPRDVSFGRQPDGGEGWYFFSEPTPHGPNIGPASTEWLNAPVFSHEPGFHAGGFQLTFVEPGLGVEIRFTLDGSEPSETSFSYGGAIAITNRAAAPNQLSLIPTVPGYVPPQATVYKGTVVRAKAFKAGALPSVETVGTFFVHPRGRLRYSTPVVALTTDPKNFFDPNRGIYVPGNAPGGNYSQRGAEWERPVYVEFMETNGLTAFAQHGDIKIHGNTSQGFPIKGLDLDGTGGAGREPFRYRMFPDRARSEFEHVMLRPSGHDHYLAFMRDEMMQSLAEDFGMMTQAARLVVVFINGEYWGLHYLKEKQDAEFVAYYGGTSGDNIDYLEGYAVARAGETRQYEALIAFLQSHDLRVSAHYDAVREFMNVSSYIDYKVSEIFCYRWDIGNHRFWRPRTPEGKFEWLQFDNDVGWGGFWAEQPAAAFNMLEAVVTPSQSLHGHNNATTTFLLAKLLENDAFKNAFINRFADLINTVYQPSNTVARIDRFAALLQPGMQEHVSRWNAPGSMAEWNISVEYLRSFAHLRPAHVRQHLIRQFNLEGTAAVSLAVSDPNHGTIRINTIEVAAPQNAPWPGFYFKDNPITVSAQAKPGFQFDRWEGSQGLDSPQETLRLSGDIELTAHFIPEPAAAPAFTSLSWKAEGILQARFSGTPGQRYAVLTSPDCRAWSMAETVVAGSDGHGDLEIEVPFGARNVFFQLRHE